MNEPKKRGRPPVQIDLETVERLARINCTEPEIAAVLGFSYRTWERHKAKNVDIKETVERGRESGKASLRRLQWQTAQDGSAAMQIWLGKNLLGQADKQQIEQHKTEKLVIVTDRTDESTDKGIHESAEVSGTGGGETVWEDVPRTH